MLELLQPVSHIASADYADASAPGVPVLKSLASKLHELFHQPNFATCSPAPSPWQSAALEQRVHHEPMLPSQMSYPSASAVCAQTSEGTGPASAHHKMCLLEEQHSAIQQTKNPPICSFPLSHLMFCAAVRDPAETAQACTCTDCQRFCTATPA